VAFTTFVLQKIFSLPGKPKTKKMVFCKKKEEKNPQAERGLKREGATRLVRWIETLQQNSELFVGTFLK